MNKAYAFVYGTLMKNHRNHGYMTDAIYIANGVIDGYEIYDLGTYPGIIDGVGSVYGEVYQITSEIEEKLDWLEEEGDLYLKRDEKVRLDNGQSVVAKVYVYNKSVEGCRKLDGKYEVVNALSRK